jgi:hypothetical protein
MSDSPQALPGQRTCLLILGMHRSGTSAVTRILNLMGAELPKQLVGPTPDNEEGHWEPERLVLLHDQMLAEAGSSWRDLRSLDLAQLSADRLEHYKSAIRSIIQEEFGSANVFVLKDPRVCRFVPLYRALLSELGIRIYPIIVIRNPLEVSASLSARNKIPNAYGLLLWLRHCLDVEKYTRDMKRTFVDYDSVVNNITDVIMRLRESFDQDFLVSSSMSKIHTVVLASVRRELRHQIFLPDDLCIDSLTRTWINEAYRAFKAFLTVRDEKLAIASVDRISCEFENASPLLAQLTHDMDALRINGEKLEENIRLLGHTIRQLHDQIQRNAEEHAQEIQRNAEQHAQEIQRNAEQHAQEIQRNAEQHAREILDNTEQYARELAGQQRIDYDRRGLPPELMGLRRWVSSRHRRLIQDYHRVAASPLFNRDWYLHKYPEVSTANMDAAWHYLQSGGREGRTPGPYFQVDAYLRANPDVAVSGQNPLLHFLARYNDGR